MSNIYYYPLLSRRLFSLLNKLAAYTSTTVPYTNYYYVNTMAATENDVVDFMYDMVECNASMSVR